MKKMLTLRCSGPLGKPLLDGKGLVVIYVKTEAKTFSGLEKAARKELDKTPSLKEWEIFSIQLGSAKPLCRPLRKVNA